MRAALEGALNMLMQLRGGSYYPSFLEPRRNVGKALLSAIQEAYINGVSARKAEKIVESLGIEIGKSNVSHICAELLKQWKSSGKCLLASSFVYLGATFPKAREGGHVSSMALAVATGVDPGAISWAWS
jgi:transposase-like protein